MQFQKIKNIFPNAHPDWVIVTVKKNGQKNFKKKKESEGTVQLWPVLQTVQIERV